MFVCTGNICRSPLAAGLAARLLAEDPAATQPRIMSAGTAATPGTPATPEARLVAAEAGVDLNTHRAIRLTARLVREADLVLGMEATHVRQAQRLAPDRAGRIALLDTAGREIADPYGLDIEAYRASLDAIRTALEDRFAHPSPGR